MSKFVIMLASVKNYDLIFYQLRNNLYDQLDNSLRRELDQLSKEIKAIITSHEKVQEQPATVLRQIFNLRIKAIRSLGADSSSDYFLRMNEIVPQIEKIKLNKQLEVLSENLLFAVRCNQRVIESLLRTNEKKTNHLFSRLSQLPEITYEQFIASLAFAIPDDEIVQKMVNWTNASLHIEFAMIAADIINANKLTISAKTINELAFLVSDAAQEYIALATELGILKSSSKIQSFSQSSFDNSFIKEQKQLADQGLEDFAANFEN